MTVDGEQMADGSVEWKGRKVDPIKCPVHNTLFFVIARSPGGKRVCPMGCTFTINDGVFVRRPASSF